MSVAGPRAADAADKGACAGSYFCRPYIEQEFLARPEHRGFIDAEVLERYYAVGGVRIEDCVLVTPAGNENLTTAPKGDELLDVVNGGG